MKVPPPADTTRPFRKHAVAALTLIDVVVVLAVIAILAGLLLPALQKTRISNHHTTCVSNLKQLGISYRLWSGDCGDHYPMGAPATSGGSLESITNGEIVRTYMVMSNELNDPKILVCPMDTERHAATNFADLQTDNLSYFVGIDAAETSPQGFLSGDRNITNGTPIQNHFLNLTTNEPAGWTEKIHDGRGFVGLADGSVQEFSADMLRKQITITGLATNRLVMP